MVSTTLVAVLKKENNKQHLNKKKPREETQSVMETYKLLLSIIKMPTVFTFCALLLTAKVMSFSQALPYFYSSFDSCNFIVICKSVSFFPLPLYFQIGFSAADAVTGLKLVEAGVPKEQLALLAVPMVPLQILLPLVISKYTAGPRPLDVFYKAFPFRYKQNQHTCPDS